MWPLLLFSTWVAVATALLPAAWAPSLALRAVVAVVGTVVTTLAVPARLPHWHLAALALHLAPLAAPGPGSACTDAALVLVYLATVDWRRSYSDAVAAAAAAARCQASP